MPLFGRKIKAPTISIQKKGEMCHYPQVPLRSRNRTLLSKLESLLAILLWFLLSGVEGSDSVDIAEVKARGRLYKSHDIREDCLARHSWCWGVSRRHY